MNPTESANYENMLSAASSGGNQGRITNDLLRDLIELMKTKFEGSRAAVLSEWTDRDMTVGNVIYKAGSVTIVDILDHAAREARLDQGYLSPCAKDA